jgi:broad specificity phosphatase PhoE
MAIFIFVRHGESIWNIEGRLMWHRIGSNLSEKWIQQVKKSIKYFKSVYPSLTKIYSSPVSRALESAELIAENYSISIQIVPELREIDFGDMTGKLLSEIPKEVDEAYFKNPYEHAHINW